MLFASAGKACKHGKSVQSKMILIWSRIPFIWISGTCRKVVSRSYLVLIFWGVNSLSSRVKRRVRHSRKSVLGRIFRGFWRIREISQKGLITLHLHLHLVDHQVEHLWMKRHQHLRWKLKRIILHKRMTLIKTEVPS